MKELLSAMDLTQVVEVLTEALLRELDDEVDFIFRYGSYLKGKRKW